MKMQTLNAVQMAQRLLLSKVQQATCLVDATMGKGGDTLFLARNSSPAATIYSFDIQAAAIKQTQELLIRHGLEQKVKLISASHATVGEHVGLGTLEVAMFNLGYLPGGDHLLITRPQATLAALHICLQRLQVGGLVSVVAYPGHTGGNEETQAVEAFLEKLPQSIFTACCWNVLNHTKYPPRLYIIEKTRGEFFEGDTARKD